MGDWDFENAERQEGKPLRRVVVSVAFPRREWEKVSAEAEAAGLPVSTYIRRKALGERGPLSTFEITSGVSSGASLTLILDKPA